MNILIISPKFHPVIGGGETYVLNSAKQLHGLGNSVSVATEQNLNRRLKDYPFSIHEITGLSDDKLNTIPAVAGLHELIEKTEPDIIHVHGYFALLVVGLCYIQSIPILCSIHSTPVWGERIIGGMNNFTSELDFAKSVIKLAQPNIITAANKVYADAARKIVNGDIPVKVLPYPIDIPFFNNSTDHGLRKNLDLDQGDKLILLPSRIIRRKGIKEAVITLNDLPSNYYLHLPGAVEPLDGNYWNEICNSEAYKKVKNRIIIPRQKILYDNMPSLYSASDIIIMPSYYEGAPVATIEAMASGKPFIGADSQGINGFIQDNKNGLLVPKMSTKELSKAIQLVSKDSSLGHRLSKQALSDIAYLSWDNQLPKLLDTYEEILNETSLSAIRLIKAR